MTIDLWLAGFTAIALLFIWSPCLRGPNAFREGVS